MADMSKTVFPWEKIAHEGREMPAGLRFSEQWLFLELRLLYCEVKREIIDRAYAAKERKRLIENFQAYQLCEQMGEEWEQALKETDLAREAYRKERTLENADKLLDAIEGTKFRRV